MRVKAIIVVIAACLAMPAAPARAAKPPEPLFAGDTLIHLTLKGPLAALRKSRSGVQAPLPGALSVQGSAPEILPVALSLRGITRRKQDVCSFPPLRLAFADKPPEGSLFKGQKRLKLVTHCQPAEGFQQYVLLEYAAYQMYALLTPLSMRARLAMIDYQDDTGRPVTTRLGFLIEDDSDVARRNGLARFKGSDRARLDQLSGRDAARFALFEYLIGNLDWSMTAGPPGDGCCHNAKLLGAEDATTGLVPVPYDFDFAGLVDPPYATPPQGMSLANVRVRRYRGYCAHNAQAQAAVADLLTRRAALLAVIDQTPQLTAKSRQTAAAYLGEAFDQIANPQQFAKVLQTCLG